MNIYTHSILKQIKQIKQIKQTMALPICGLALSGCMFAPMHQVTSNGAAIHAAYSGSGGPTTEIGFGGLQTGSNPLHFGSCGGGGDIPMARSFSLSGKVHSGEGQWSALEASLWRSAVLGAGITMTYYTDFTSGNLQIRPDFGVEFPIGPLWIRGTVGYSIPFTNQFFHNVSKEQYRVCVTIPMTAAKVR